MDIKIVIGGVCAAVIISEMLLMLLPSGGMKKFARFAVGLMVAAMLVAPLRSCESLPLNAPQESIITENAKTGYSDVIWDVYKKELENINGKR